MKTRKSSYSHRLNSVGVLACLAGLLSSYHASAAAEAWIASPSNALWSNAANWSGVNTPPVSGDTLTFGTSSVSTLNNDLTNSAFVVKTMTFFGATAYTISGNDFTLGDGTAGDIIFHNAAPNLTINNNITVSNQSAQRIRFGSSGTMTLGGIIGSAGSNTSVRVLGTGSSSVLVLTGTVNVANQIGISNAFVKIDGGKFTASILDNYGSGTIQVTNGGSFTISNDIWFKQTLIQDSGSVSLGTSGANLLQYLTLNTTGGTATIQGSLYQGIKIDASGTAVVNLGANQKLVSFDPAVTGVLSVGGSASVTFANTLDLANTTSAGTINLNGGVLTLPGLSKTNAASTTTVNLNSGTLRLSAATTLAATTNTAFNVLGGGAVIDTQANAVTLQQALLNGGGAGGLTKVGSGTLTLTGNNTYVGDTAVSVGTLVVGTGGSINTSSKISVATGATLQNSNGAAVTPDLALNEGAAVLTSTAGSSFAPVSLTLVGDLSDGWTAISLTASAGSGLIKDGAFVLNLTGITAGTYNLTSGTGFSGAFDTASVNGNALTLIGQDFTGSNIGGFNYAYTNSTNQLVITAVPEPSTWMLLTAVGTVAIVMRRRRAE